MCGITGYVSIDNHENDLIVSLNSLKHRGPDNINHINYHNNKFFIGLGHSRLSIIDTSRRSNQPMVSTCQKIILSYNGEIYNFKKIKKKLISKGVEFKTSSDTEVIIEYYKKYGKKGFNDFDGIFSFSLLDKNKNKLFLVRDHMGIKPLYYFINKKNKKISFSSEIKSIKNYEFVDSEISIQDVYEFFNCGWLYEPNTGYLDIKKVKPGEYIEIDLDIFKIKFVKFYKPFLNKNNLNTSTVNMIEQNINSQLVSDVSLGLFFSGGVDSSIIAAFSNQKLNSISINYSKKELKLSGVTNDYPYQKRIADLLNIKLTHSSFKTDHSKDIISFYKKTVIGNEELNCDLTFIPSYNLSKIAKKNKFKVMLSGMGGDEMFAGYPRYLVCRYYNFFNIIYYLIKPFSFILKFKKSLSKKINRFNSFFKEKEFELSYNRLIGYFSSNELDEMFKNKNLKIKFLNKLKFITRPVKKLSYLKKAIYMDYYGFLSHNLMVADKSSMLNSIELRVPLLSKSIFQNILKIPDNLLISNFSTKILLKNMLELKLPKKLIYRKKTGFNPPLDNHINILGKKNILKLFDDNNIYLFLSKKPINSIIQNNFNKSENNTYKISQLIYFSFWLQENYNLKSR